MIFFGPIALTQQFLPQLRASRGRVINVTSIGGIMPGPMIAAYQAAKAALEAVSDSMRIEFLPIRRSGLQPVVPASISTPMLKRSSDQLNRIADVLPKNLQPFYADALRAFAKTTVKADRFSISAEKASQTILRAVTAPRPRAHYLIGGDREGRRVHEAQPSRPLDGCDHFPDDGSAAR